MNALHNYKHMVQYYETDKMAIVHHSNYIRWFEEARVDLLNQLGIGYFGMEREGIISPVLSVECKFVSMTKFGDTVDVETTVSEYNGIRLFFEYRIFDSISKELRCTGKSSHCFLNSNGRPVNLKKVYPKAHEAIIALIEE